MYELILLVSPLVEKIDTEIVAKIRDLILGLEGNIKKEYTWEKRKLAYPIKKQLFGTYIIFEFALLSEKMEEMQKQLKLNSDIMRYLIINKEGVKEERPRVRAMKPKIIAPLPPSEAKGEKVKIEELDKKLEEILKE
jgi:small subunit ribosomal protein S6